MKLKKNEQNMRDKQKIAKKTKDVNEKVNKNIILKF